MMHFHVITLFPDSLSSYLKSSIVKRAIEDKKIAVHTYNPKDFTVTKKDRVDRRPYGGGPGMVLEPLAMLKACEAAVKKAKKIGGKARVLFFATDGEQFDEPKAATYAKAKHLIMICGRYEGVDARVAKIMKAESLTVGPFVLTGGELPALLVIDGVARFVKGVLGDALSLERSRVSSPEVYTRPEVLVWKRKKYAVPEVLKSGNHAAIDAWKKGEKVSPKPPQQLQ